ncbi:MAG: Fe-S cluster assembly ATPase SufC [Alphaproteobacteria bacterium]
MSALLQLNDLRASVTDSHGKQKQVLHGVDLTLKAGEMHVLMGPNGSGKSSLASLLAGREGYEASGGEALLDGEDILALPPEERAARGLFLAFQYPVEIAGLSSTVFLREIYNRRREREGESVLDPMAFMRVLREEMSALSMDAGLARRAVNAGFSGGEKKQGEVLQLALLQPRLAVMDETDSGLDIDALRLVSAAINRHRDSSRGFLLITHYSRLLAELDPAPDYIHIFDAGRIVRSGGLELAHQLEESGYETLAGKVA